MPCFTARHTVLVRCVVNERSSFTPACLITFAHVADSARMSLASCSGVLPEGMAPSAIRRAEMSGMASTLTVAACSVRMTAAGVPAFRHPESCAEAMALCLLRAVPRPEPALPDPPRVAVDAFLAGKTSGFDERRAADFFGADAGQEQKQSA